MSRHALAPLALFLLVPSCAHAASLTPPNLVTAPSLNNTDLLLVWPYAAGGPLESMSWSTFKSQMATGLTGSFLSPSNNLADVGNPTIARSNLGLGSAAVVATGTSGGALCLLNANCTVSGTETHTGAVMAAASTTAKAGLNLAAGSAPSSPVNGDVWTTSAGLFARINGATLQVTPVTGALTPTLAFATAGSSSFSYSLRGGSYSCVGNYVTGEAWIQGTITAGTGSGILKWTNLPYAINDNAMLFVGGSPVFLAGSWATLNALPYFAAESSTAAIQFGSQSGTTFSAIQATNVPGTAIQMYWTFAYPVSAC